MEKQSIQKKGINSNRLKTIAIIAMTIDHLVSVIWPGYPKDWWIIVLHIIGRLTAPTMWFLIAEGYHYTRNVKKYIGRLFLFAIISHFAYNFAFGIPFIPFQTSVFNQTSVIWSLAWGVVAIALTDEKNFALKGWQKSVLVMIICLITFCSDWSCIAVLAILAIYGNRGNLKKQVSGMMIWVLMYAVIYFLFIDKVYGILQLFVIICVPFIKQYNGERGKWKGMKWFFYIYYPAHLIVCGIIRVLLHGNIGVMIGG
ncbi:MAG: conjugal transfer protein TraX [Lachnospiraceae bacterium]|nr:conjugal transfer protein TraX [Lachnospiraceae bacterium]